MGEAARHRGRVERVVEASTALTWSQKAVWLTDYRFSQMGTEGSWMSHAALGERLGMSDRSVETYRQLFLKLAICERVDRKGARNPGWRPCLPPHCTPSSEGKSTTAEVVTLAAAFDEWVLGRMPERARGSDRNPSPSGIVPQVRAGSYPPPERDRTSSPSRVGPSPERDRTQKAPNPKQNKAVTASDRSLDRIGDRSGDRRVGESSSDIRSDISQTRISPNGSGAHENGVASGDAKSGGGKKGEPLPIGEILPRFVEQLQRRADEDPRE